MQSLVPLGFVIEDWHVHERTRICTAELPYYLLHSRWQPSGLRPEHQPNPWPSRTAIERRVDGYLCSFPCGRTMNMNSSTLRRSSRPRTRFFPHVSNSIRPRIIVLVHMIDAARSGVSHPRICSGTSPAGSAGVQHSLPSIIPFRPNRGSGGASSNIQQGKETLALAWHS